MDGLLGLDCGVTCEAWLEKGISSAKETLAVAVERYWQLLEGIDFLPPQSSLFPSLTTTDI